MQERVEARDRHIERSRMVQDNLKTYTPGSFEQAFAPQEVCALAQKVELH